MVESAPLLREYTREGIEGSNPSRSARPQLSKLSWGLAVLGGPRTQASVAQPGSSAAFSLEKNQIAQTSGGGGLHSARPERSEDNPSQSAILPFGQAWTLLANSILEPVPIPRFKHFQRI